MFDELDYTDGPQTEVFMIVWQIQALSGETVNVIAKQTFASNEIAELKSLASKLANKHSECEIRLVSQHEMQFVPGLMDGLA